MRDLLVYELNDDVKGVYDKMERYVGRFVFVYVSYFMQFFYLEMEFFWLIILELEMGFFMFLV